jgi:hypothetical protein
LAENSKQENNAFSTGSTIQTRRRTTMSPRFDEFHDDNAGIGFAFLGIEQVFYSIAVILIGVILGWATGLNKSADVVGAVSSFFGYLGFDAMACVAGEAINAKRN